MRLSSKEQKILQKKKNKPYKAFSRFQTDLNLVGLDCLLYIILILYRLQWRIFQDFLELFYCHSSVFRCFFNRHTALSHLLNQHLHLTNANAFGLYPLTTFIFLQPLSFHLPVEFSTRDNFSFGSMYIFQPSLSGSAAGYQRQEWCRFSGHHRL